MSESEVAGIGGGAAGGYPALMAHAYQSASDAEAGDFKSIYASAITLAISELPFTPLFENFVSVVEYDGDRVVASYDLTREDLDWDWTPGADTTTGVLTVDTAVFDAASTFVVTMRGPAPEVIDVMTDFGGPYTHQSQRDFDAIWKAVTTLDVGTVSAMAMVPDKDDFRAVAEIAAGGKLRRVYTRISHGFTWAPAGGGDEGVLTIVGADLLAGSTFIVFVAGPELGTARADAATGIDTSVKRTQPIDKAGNVITAGGGPTVVINATGAGAISITTASAKRFRLSEVTCHLSAGPTTPEDFTITLDALDGAAYDTLLFDIDPSLLASQDIVHRPNSKTIYEAGDQIVVAYPNTDVGTYGLRIVIEEF